MKGFVDTSVLVAAFQVEHEDHEPSFRLFRGLEKGEGACGAHSLAEVYSTLTRMPGRLRVSGREAMLVVGAIEARLTLVALDAGEYGAAIGGAAEMGVLGGAIYDALLAACALKAGAEAIYTWNVKDYERLGGEVRARVRRPG